MTRLRRKGLATRSVVVKVRDHAFDTAERRRSLARPSSSTRQIFAVAGELFDGFDLRGRRVRLVGVGVGDLCGGALQLTFDERWKETALDEVVDGLRAKYGTAVVRPAATCVGEAPMC